MSDIIIVYLCVTWSVLSLANLQIVVSDLHYVVSLSLCNTSLLWSFNSECVTVNSNKHTHCV